MLIDSPIWDFLDKWRTPNCYSNQYDPLPNGPGIYLLVLAYNDEIGRLGHRILYVGQSTNVKQRLRNHEVKKACQRDFKNDYIKVYFQRCSEEQLRKRERKLIREINPPYNLQHRVRGV